MKEAYQH